MKTKSSKKYLSEILKDVGSDSFYKNIYNNI